MHSCWVSALVNLDSIPTFTKAKNSMLIFLFYFIFISLCVCICAHVCVCPCVYILWVCAYKEWDKIVDPLEQKLQAVMRCLTGMLGSKPRSSGTTAGILNH